jgi:hypothetical protein
VFRRKPVGKLVFMAGIQEDYSQDIIRIAGGIEPYDEAPEGVADQNIGRSDLRPDEENAEFRGDLFRRSRQAARRGIAPGVPGPVVGAYLREPGDFRLYEAPGGSESAEARFQDDGRFAFAHAPQVQFIAPDIDQCPGRIVERDFCHGKQGKGVRVYIMLICINII